MRGDKQVHGIDYFDSYATVVQWTTICLTLILAMLWNWETVQTDYTNAFALLTLGQEIYMDMPHDFIVGTRPVARDCTVARGIAHAIISRPEVPT